MKPKKSKKEESAELAQAINAFLESGGSVQHIPKGFSGNTDNRNVFQNKTSFEPKSSRTPLTEVVKTLEERKQQGKTKTKSYDGKKARKKLLVDDFGDPIRWVWDES